MFCNRFAIRTIYTNIDYSIKSLGRNHAINLFSIGSDGFGFFSTDRNVNFGGIIPEITAFNVQAGSHTSLFRAKICKYYWLRWVILIRVGFIIFTTDEE